MGVIVGYWQPGAVLRNWNFIFGFITGSSIFAVFQWMYKRRRSKEINYFRDTNDDCIFFSPKLYTVKCLGEKSGGCGYLSCPACNYQKFLEMIKSAKSSLDICMYLITSEELTNVIINLFKRGLYVRIIIDKQMSDEAFNAKVNVFLKQHIPMKIVNLGETMHNKFVIIDKKKLITGSFNWTKQAMLYNYENAVVIHDENIIRKYDLYFQDIWLS